MATLVTKTVGSGGGRDYSTLAAVLAAMPTNLTTADEQWDWELANDSEFTGSFTLSGITTDATRYIHVKTMAGASWKDHASVATNAGFYDQSKGVGIKTTTSYTTTFTVSVDYTRVTGLQVQAADANQGVAFVANGANCEVRDNLFYGREPVGFPPSTGLKFVNNLCISRSGNMVLNTIYADGGRFEFNTFVRNASGGSLPQVAYATVTFENCAFFGFTSGFSTNTGGVIVADYCATDQASLAGGGTHNQLSLNYADQFENSSSDYRNKKIGNLRNGTPATSYATTDARGQARDATKPWIGYWENPPVAFPGTSVLDDFNRANVADLVPGWSADPMGVASAMHDIVSNAATNGQDAYYATLYGADQEVWATLVTLDPGSAFGLFARIQSPATSGADSYSVRWQGTTLRVDRNINAYTTGSDILATATIPAVASGYKLGMRVTGSGATVTVDVYVDMGGGWVGPALTTTDTNAARITAAGYLGFFTFSFADVVDDFGGGAIGAAFGNPWYAYAHMH